MTLLKDISKNLLRWLLLFALLAVPVAAQEAPPSAMTPSPALGEYPKSKAIAVGLEIVVPILGHGYAGNAKKGIPPALATLGGYIAIATALDEDGEIKDDKEGVVLAGSAAVIAGRVWALMQVSKMVDEHNKRLTLEPTGKDRLGAKLVFRF